MKGFPPPEPWYPRGVELEAEMLSWKEKKALPRSLFADRIVDAFCVGQGADFRDDWDRYPDSRVFENGYAIAYRAREYILVSWSGVSLRECTLYYFRGDSDVPEIVAPAIDNSRYEVEDAVLGHGNPKRLAEVLARREEWKRQRRTALHRQETNRLAATLPPKSYFSTPAGRVGQVIGVGAKVVTWRYLDDLPEGAVPMQIAGEPWERVG